MRARRLKMPEDAEGSKPVAAVGDPPTHKTDRDGSKQAPHQGQSKIGDQAQCDEDGPEDLPLHSYILTR